MTDLVGKHTIGTEVTDYDLYVAGTYQELDEVLFDEATGTYAPAVGDVLCRKTDDSNKHQKYIETDAAALVILGVVDEVKTDGTTPTAIMTLAYAINATVHYAKLGTTGVDNAAKKLALVDALRAKNINCAV